MQPVIREQLSQPNPHEIPNPLTEAQRDCHSATAFPDLTLFPPQKSAMHVLKTRKRASIIRSVEPATIVTVVVLGGIDKDGHFRAQLLRPVDIVPDFNSKDKVFPLNKCEILAAAEEGV